MSLLSRLRMHERLGTLTLLLVLLAVLTGVSLTQAGLLDHGADQLEDSVLPALRRTQDVRRLLDEARGLEAQQLLAETAQDREAGLVQLKRQRRLVEAQLAATGRGGEDDEDRRLKALVQERLAQYWAAQDRVLAALASQPEPADAAPEPGHPARRLLAEESQAAWRAVSEALVFWYQHQEQRAAALARQSRAQAGWLRIVTGGLLGLVFAASLAALWRRQRGYAVERSSGTAITPSVLPAPDLPETLDSIAVHSRLVALNAAVQAARTGEPTEADLAERAHLASEAEALARRCDEARRGLRLGQPKARSGAAAAASGFGPSTRPFGAD